MNEGQALESKATQLLCAQCGSRLTSSDDGEKFCIHCLLRSALGQDDIDPSKTLRRSDQLIPGDNGAPIEFGDYELLEEIGRGSQGVVPCPAKKSQSHRRAEGDRVGSLGHGTARETIPSRSGSSREAEPSLHRSNL